MVASKLKPRLPQTLLAMLLLATVVACQRHTPATSTAHSETGSHHHGHSHDEATFDSLPAAVSRTASLLKTVADCFERAEPAEADEALHELGTLLQEMPKLAAETDLPEAEWTKVRESSTRLFDRLDQLHAGFHGEGPIQTNYATYREAIERDLAILESAAAQLPLAADTDAEKNSHEAEHEAENRDAAQ